MQAQNTTIRGLLDGSKQFVIPVFQRDYTWEEGNWRQLWEDIRRDGGKDGGPGHFMGSIVHVKDGALAALNRFLVVDGQQRLTTFALLCAAMRDHIKETGWQSGSGSPTPEQIDGFLLRNHLLTGNEVYKLVLRRNDDETLRAVVEGKGFASLERAKSERVARAYDYFRQELALPEIDVLSVWEGALRIRIVEIALERPADDPQSVFESMNSTGVALTAGDLIRNYLLMGIEEQEQTRLYSDYWGATEGYFRTADGALNDDVFDAFLQDYLALKLGRNERVRQNRIYPEFKRRRDTLQGGGTLEELLDEIRRFARYYAAFRERTAVGTNALADAMRNMRRRGTTPAVLVLRLYDCFDREKNLSASEFVRALGLIESYLLRRAVIGQQARWGSYYKIFSDMAKDIHNNADPTPLETVERHLLSWKEWYGPWRFPRDGEFTQALETHDLYSLGGVCKHLLDRLENYDTREPAPVADFQIEHIMPQSIGPEWQAALGADWQQVHSDWLHRLGNLTLTAYNPGMSNHSFEEKKTMEHGFNESAVRLTNFVQQQSQWTADEMDKRGKQLAERALKIWPYPQES